MSPDRPRTSPTSPRNRHGSHQHPRSAGREGPGRNRRHRRGLGAHPPRLEGRAVLRAGARRHLLRRPPGRRARRAARTTRPRSLRLTAGCAVRVDGELVASQGKGQSVELRAAAIEVVGWVDDPETYPMQPKRHTLEFLREVAHLRPRTNTFGAVTRVRHCLAQAIHRFFHERGFFWIHTPIITASDAEGAGEMFRVSTLDLANLPRTPDGKVDFAQDFFGREAYLTVSGQLNVETYCCALSKVYTFGPTFRAENSNTAPPPVRVLDDRAGDRVRRPVRRRRPRRGLPAGTSSARCSTSGPTTWRSSTSTSSPACVARLEAFVESAFARMDYSEAVAALEAAKKKFEFPVGWGMDLQSEHERYLTEEHRRPPGRGHELPEGHQGVLHAPERRREDRRRDGRAGPGHRRDHRRQPARGAPRRARRPHRPRWGSTRRPTGGTATCAATAPCRTRASGSASSASIKYATGMENIRDVIPFPRAPKSADF